MHLSQIVEFGKAARVLHAPLHPYPQALVSAIPEIDTQKKKQRIVLMGDPPNPENIPPGCPFHPRCRYVIAACRQTPPELRVTQDREVACHLYL
jgi:peptide/nickel transport system ATP-binding protein